MHVFDAHCDALLKLWRHPDLSFTEMDERLQVSLPAMEAGQVLIQTFAIWTPREIEAASRFHTALEMIELFYRKIIPAGLAPVLTAADLEDCVLNNRKGAILFVEGAEPVGESMTYLRTLHRLGVRGMGLTWNNRNAIADGCLEPSAGGLSHFGREVIEEMNQLGMVIDVSHLAEPGFWDVLSITKQPIIASHSNARALFESPRNLSDEQISALIANGGVMGLALFPPFYREDNEAASIDDILRHVEHICGLGGIDHVAIGADFDGIDATFPGLEHAGTYPLLVEALLKRYQEAEVEKIMYKNWLRVFGNVLK
ncbi:UNVERIFIED_CONTAM: membrane dipeptidase [Brevibacillus sp. OAP136]